MARPADAKLVAPSRKHPDEIRTALGRMDCDLPRRVGRRLSRWRPSPNRRRRSLRAGRGTSTARCLAAALGRGRIGVDRGCQGIGVHDVASTVLDKCCHVGHGVDDPRDTGTDALGGGCAARGALIGQAHQVEQVRPLRLVELKGGAHAWRTRLRRLRRCRVQSRVVLDADARDERDFLASQAATRRCRPNVGRPARSGVILARRVVRNSRISSLLLMSRTPYARHDLLWESLAVPP